MTAVVVVGVGAMGSRIAARLVAAGHEVTVWNRPGRPGRLPIWANVAATPADAASEADVLLTMVADPAALRAVTEGPDGVVADANVALTVVEMATVGRAPWHDWHRRCPGDGAARRAGPGRPAEAESGSLVIFAGGPGDLVSPVVAAVGSVLHVGDLGAGAAAKLMANAALSATLGRLGIAVQFLSIMLLAEPGQKSRQPATRPGPAGNGTDASCRRAKAGARQPRGQQLQPCAEPRVLRVYRPSRDLGSGQADPIR